MGTTVDSIDDAIMSALVPLVKTSANPSGVVLLLERFAMDSPDAEKLGAYVMNRTPAILVGLQDEEGAEFRGLSKAVHGPSEATTTCKFSVLVVVQDVRQPVDRALKGNPSGTYYGAAGCYKLMGLVKARLVNLALTGTWHDWPLHYEGMKPFVTEAGKLYAYELTFSAMYVEADAPQPVMDATPFDTFAANFNRVGTAEQTNGTPPPPDPSNPLQNPRDSIQQPIVHE